MRTNFWNPPCNCIARGCDTDLVYVYKNWACSTRLTTCWWWRAWRRWASRHACRCSTIATTSTPPSTSWTYVASSRWFKLLCGGHLCTCPKKSLSKCTFLRTLLCGRRAGDAGARRAQADLLELCHSVRRAAASADRRAPPGRRGHHQPVRAQQILHRGNPARCRPGQPCTRTHAEFFLLDIVSSTS